MSGVSVIIPVFNREKYLAECIQSVLDQERDFPLEIIIADDGSTDRSMEIAKSYGFPVIVLEKPFDCKTQGPGPTRNRGIEASRYHYIAFLDSDDMFLPGHLQRLYDALHKNPNILLAIDQLCVMYSDIEKREVLTCPDKNHIRLESMFLSPYSSPDVLMINRSILADIGGGFDEELVLAQDIDFFFRALEKHNGMVLDGEGAVYREHEGRSVRNQRKCFQYAELAMKKAIKRYPYSRKLIRKRKTILNFYLAKPDLAEKKYFAAVWKLFKAFCGDPIHSIKVVLFRKISPW